MNNNNIQRDIAGIKTENIIVSNNMIILIFSMIIWFFFPVFSIFLFLFFIGFKNIELFAQVEICLVILIACSFGLISYVTGSGGTMDTDMIRYRQSFDTLVDLGTEKSLATTGNFLFFVANLFLANFISTDSQVMSFVFTSVSYFFLIESILMLSKFFQKDKYLTLILFSVVFIVSLMTTTEYLKQVLASSVFLFSLSLKLTGKKFGYVWLIISLLLHMGSTILILPLYFYDKKIVKKYIYIIFLVCLIFSQIDPVLILSKYTNSSLIQMTGFAEKISSFSNFTSWGGSRRYYLIFFFFLFQISPIFYFFAKKKSLKNPVSILFILIVSILLFTMSNNHNFARLTRNLYPFQILAVIVSTVYINIKYKKLWIYFCYVCLLGSNLIEFQQGLSKGEYYPTFMGNDFFRLLYSNVLDFINYNVS